MFRFISATCWRKYIGIYWLMAKCFNEILIKNETIHTKYKIIRCKVLISQIHFSVYNKNYGYHSYTSVP